MSMRQSVEIRSTLCIKFSSPALEQICNSHLSAEPSNGIFKDKDVYGEKKKWYLGLLENFREIQSKIGVKDG